MSGRGLDPGFTALPYRRLGEVALTRARRARRDARRLPLRTGPLPAPRRPRRAAAGRQRPRGPRVRGPGAARRILGVRRRGAAGRGGGARRGRAGRGGGAGRGPDEHGARRDRPRAGLRRRHLGLGLRRRPADGAGGREGRRPHRLDASPAGRPGGRARQRVPAAGAREQVLRRPRRHPDHPAAGAGPARLRGDGLRGATPSTPWRAPHHRPGAAGSTSPAPPTRAPGTSTPSSPRFPAC